MIKKIKNNNVAWNTIKTHGISFLIGAIVCFAILWFFPIDKYSESDTASNRERESEIARIEKYSQRVTDQLDNARESNRRLNKLLNDTAGTSREVTERLADSIRRAESSLQQISKINNTNRRIIEYLRVAKQLITKIIEGTTELTKLLQQLPNYGGEGNTIGKEPAR